MRGRRIDRTASRGRASRWHERGQSLTEFAIALPVLLILLLALIQFGVVFSHYVNLTDAVRVAGRALSTCRFGGNATQAGNNAAGGLAITWTVTPTPGGSTVPCTTLAGTQVTVQGQVKHEKLNIFGLFPSFGDITLSSSVTVTEE